MISPILSNVYLHYVLDKWFEQEVKPRLKGRALMIRYADDAVLLFSEEADALTARGTGTFVSKIAKGEPSTL